MIGSISSAATQSEPLPHHWEEVGLLLLWPQSLWVVRVHRQDRSWRAETAGRHNYNNAKLTDNSSLNTLLLYLFVKKAQSPKLLYTKWFSGAHFLSAKMQTVYRNYIHIGRLIQGWLTLTKTAYIIYDSSLQTSASTCRGVRICQGLMYFSQQSMGEWSELMLAEINHKTQPSAVQIPCTASPSVGMYEPMHEREKKKTLYINMVLKVNYIKHSFLVV